MSTKIPPAFSVVSTSPKTSGAGRHVAVQCCSYSTAAASYCAYEMRFLLRDPGPWAALTHFYMGTFIGIHTFIYCAHKHPPPTHTLALHLLPSAEPAPPLNTPCSPCGIQALSRARHCLFPALRNHLAFSSFVLHWPKERGFFVNLLVKLKMRQSQE